MKGRGERSRWEGREKEGGSEMEGGGRMWIHMIASRHLWDTGVKKEGGGGMRMRKGGEEDVSNCAYTGVVHCIVLK